MYTHWKGICTKHIFYFFLFLYSHLSLSLSSLLYIYICSSSPDSIFTFLDLSLKRFICCTFLNQSILKKGAFGLLMIVFFWYMCVYLWTLLKIDVFLYVGFLFLVVFVFFRLGFCVLAWKDLIFDLGLTCMMNFSGWFGIGVCWFSWKRGAFWFLIGFGEEVCGFGVFIGYVNSKCLDWLNFFESMLKVPFLFVWVYTLFFHDSNFWFFALLVM